MSILNPWFVALFGLAGLMGKRNHQVIDYLTSENRVLSKYWIDPN